MQSRSPRRPQKSAAERNAILATFDASGLSSRDFARQHGICVSTLYRWRRLASGGEGTNRACLLELPRGVGTPRTQPTYRRLFPSGGSLEVAPGFDPDDLRTLSELLRTP